MSPQSIINITIRIADLPRLSLHIPREKEELVRRVESDVNELWRSWSAREEFGDKSSAQILAMVAFRFAQLYYENLEASQGLDNVLADLESTFDGLLLEDIIPPVSPAPDDARTE